MKKITLLFALIISVVVFTSCNNSNATSKINKSNLERAKSRDLETKKESASISFDTKEYDFGTVNEGYVVEKNF
jgi:lipopolysaccharide export LptBFGC system permease protein LptF